MMTGTDDPYDETEFRFRGDDEHNREMLEYQAEVAFKKKRPLDAAGFSIAAGLYNIAVRLGELDGRIDGLQDVIAGLPAAMEKDD